MNSSFSTELSGFNTTSTSTGLSDFHCIGGKITPVICFNFFLKKLAVVVELA